MVVVIVLLASTIAVVLNILLPFHVRKGKSIFDGTVITLLAQPQSNRYFGGAF